VVRRDEVTVGVGGAVVALSDPAAELDEILVKGRALVEATGDALDPRT
jgi:para-aminobenzoate synthetase